MLAAVAILLGLATLFAWGKPIMLLFVGRDNRYSNSQTQLVLWFGCMIAGYLSLLYFRWHSAQLLGFISIPQNLLLLSGLSGLTFAGAKAVTQQKGDDAVPARAARKRRRARPASPTILPATITRASTWAISR